MRLWLLPSATLVLGLLVGATLPMGSANAIAPPQSVATPPADYSRYRKLDMLARSLAMIERYYVRPVDDQALVYAAIAGLVSELDPHTSFLPPREARLLHEDIEGAFGGIGL